MIWEMRTHTFKRKGWDASLKAFTPREWTSVIVQPSNARIWEGAHYHNEARAFEFIQALGWKALGGDQLALDVFRGSK